MHIPERHSLTHTSDQECVSDSQQRQVLVECQVLCVQEYDGLVGQRREFGVDVGHDIRNTTLNFILLCRLEGDLDKDSLQRYTVNKVVRADYATIYLANEFGILVEEHFKRLDLVPDALYTNLVVSK